MHVAELPAADRLAGGLTVVGFILPLLGLSKADGKHLRDCRIKVARIVLHIDPSREPERARGAWESHVARDEWMTEHRYRDLLRGNTRR